MVGVLFACYDLGVICAWHGWSLWCLGVEFEADSDDESECGVALWGITADGRY